MAEAEAGSTRSQGIGILQSTTDVQAFEHLIDIALKESGKDQPVWRVLIHAGVDNWIDFMALSETEISQFESPEKKKMESLSTSKNRKLILLRRYLIYLRDTHELDFEDSISINEGLVVITAAEYDKFRISKHSEDNASPPVPPAPSPHVPSASPWRKDSATAFKQTVKKDKTQYPLFKDERFWDSWNRSFIITATSHDLENVLNKKYKPSNLEEVQLFKAQQAFTYSVLNDCLLTDFGKTLVREHLKDMDAQTVYSKLCDYHENSTKAKLSASELLSYITTARYDSRWRGTATSFILHWKNQLRLLDEVTPTSDRFSNAARRALLENAVHGVEELRGVKTLEDHEVTMRKPSLSYPQYFDLVYSAATRYD